MLKICQGIFNRSRQNGMMILEMRQENIFELARISEIYDLQLLQLQWKESVARRNKKMTILSFL